MNWAFDLAVAAQVQHIYFLWLVQTMTVVTYLGSPAVMSLLMTIVALWFLWKQQRRKALFIAGSTVLSVLIVQIIKFIVLRPRPSFALIDEVGYSFPSGHAAASAAFFGTLLVLTMRSSSLRLRTARIILCILLPLLIGFSRVFLAVHWMSDVLVGYLVGIASIAITKQLFMDSRLRGNDKQK